jgi:hypothetical protein
MRSNGGIKAPRLQSAAARFAGRSSGRFYPSIRRPQAVERGSAAFTTRPQRHPALFLPGAGRKKPRVDGVRVGVTEPSCVASTKTYFRARVS